MGQVQGVGFRFTALDIARDLGVTGGVKNLRDGRVEVVAEGEEWALKKFLSQINESFSHYIQDTDVEWKDALEEFKDFSIKF